MNLTSFTCVVRPKLLPHFLRCIEDKINMREIRILGSLKKEQANQLLKLNNIRYLALYQGSWNIIDALPKWSVVTQRTLTTLVLYKCDDLNGTVLEATLVQLPQLIGLHVIRCPKISSALVVRLTAHTPMLQSLTMSTGQRPAHLGFILSPYLRHLRELTLDIHATSEDSGTPIISHVLYQLKRPIALSSFSVRFDNLVEHSYILQLLDSHAGSLRNLSFNCRLGLESIIAICDRCVYLEVLEVAFPIKEFVSAGSPTK
ncbi:hypothetical protein AX17_001721 [Amanita inopinata Kibby_2008]|nr:hypothetical protein AX17_001721 [Amanita inopinata Kibby_2008]